jgi:cupin superfamily acireductone dioxygenase involved in methionine salvage
MRIGVGASLLTGSLLLLTGKRKAGLLVTAAGTALAMLDNREVVAEWWEALPQHLDKAQQILNQTQHTIDDLTAKRDKIFELFGK